MHGMIATLLLSKLKHSIREIILSVGDTNKDKLSKL